MVCPRAGPGVGPALNAPAPSNSAPALLAIESAPLGGRGSTGAGSPSLSTLLFSLGLVVLLLTVALTLRRRLRRGTPGADLSPGQRIERVRAGASAPGNASAARAAEGVGSLMADAEELTRRLAAVMDDRAARLESLLTRAEHAAARLEGALGIAQPHGSDPAHAEAKPGARSIGATDDPVNREIYSLADEGLEPVEIARRLEEHVGKVELILALRAG